MLIGGVKCVLQVHEEGVAFPAEAIFDEGVREASPVEEIGHRDPNGMRAPQFELWAV